MFFIKDDIVFGSKIIELFSNEKEMKACIFCIYFSKNLL